MFFASSGALRTEANRSIWPGRSSLPDPEFRKRIQSSISPKPSGRRWGWIVEAGAALRRHPAGDLRFAWSGCGSRSVSKLVGELTDLHVATLASANRVDVVSSDRHTVKPWFQGKVPFTFNVPELQGSPFELLGGKVTYLDQNPGAELLFTVRKHVLSVFIFKDSPELDRGSGLGRAHAPAVVQPRILDGRRIALRDRHRRQPLRHRRPAGAICGRGTMSEGCGRDGSTFDYLPTCSHARNNALALFMHS